MKLRNKENRKRGHHRDIEKEKGEKKGKERKGDDDDDEMDEFDEMR